MAQGRDTKRSCRGLAALEEESCHPFGATQPLPGLGRAWDALRVVEGSPPQPGGGGEGRSVREGSGGPQRQLASAAIPGALTKMEPAVQWRRGGEGRRERREGCAGELVTVCSEECNCPCDRGRRGRGARPASFLLLRCRHRAGFGWKSSEHLEGLAG